MARCSADFADACTATTIATYFGTLGTDFGFNNCRATAFFELETDQLADLRAKARSGVAVAARSADGAAAGCCFVTASGPGRAKLTNLAVLADFRRQGLGRRLVDAAVVAFRDESPECAAVDLEVLADNAAAIALYAERGWTVAKEREGTRIRVDWWRGRVIEPVAVLEMTRAFDVAEADVGAGGE